MTEEANVFEDGPVAVPITDELDLHAFRPDEISSLLPEYFAECRARGILAVRVVHGKGTGALRAGVHDLLQQMPGVKEWTWPASGPCGGWGATWVYLDAEDGARQPEARADA